MGHARTPSVATDPAFVAVADLVVDGLVKRVMRESGETDYELVLHRLLDAVPWLKQTYAGRETP